MDSSTIKDGIVSTGHLVSEQSEKSDESTENKEHAESKLQEDEGYLRNKLTDMYNPLNVETKRRFSAYLGQHILRNDKRCQDLYFVMSITPQTGTTSTSSKDELEYIVELLTSFILERRSLMPDKYIYE